MAGKITAKEEMRCGLEIHQQLDTKKLFCRCDSEIRDDKPDLTVKRRLRAVAGETEEIDIAARYEMEKEKYFVYQFYKDCNCLVELDEEPPHEMNMEALKIALQIAKALNCTIVDEIHVMRKTVVDGSNTSGFQRTALIARNGFLNIKGKKISIPTVCLEEEACKIVERRDDYDVYNLTRLGIPLVEIATGPDISTPEEAAEVAEAIGMICRSTGKVKRGIGTIRQDINVSVPGGNRIEIKGASELKMVAEYVRNEVNRQKKLIEIKSRIVNADIKKEFVDLTSIFSNTKSKVIQKAFQEKGSVIGLKLDNFSGFLGIELQPNKRLGTELSDYAKARAGVSGLFHSDELPNYGITEYEVNEVKKCLGCRQEDAFVIIAGPKEKAMRAMEAVYERALLVYEGVPREVRQPKDDGTTSYQRPMPGAARMYPETDVRPIIVNFEIPKIELIDDKARRYESLGLGKDLAYLTAKEKPELFEKLLGFKNVKPAFIAETILPKMLEIKRRTNLDIEKFEEKYFEEIFSLLDAGKITKHAIDEIIIEILKTGKCDYSNFYVLSGKELEGEIKAFLERNKGKDKKILLNITINQFKKKADIELITRITNNLLKKSYE